MEPRRPNLLLVTPETYSALLQEAEWRNRTALSPADRLQMRWIQLQGRRIPGTRWTVLWRLCLAKYQVRRFRRWLHYQFVYRPQVAWAYHVVYRKDAPMPRCIKSAYWPTLRELRLESRKLIKLIPFTKTEVPGRYYTVPAVLDGRDYEGDDDANE